MVEDLSRSGWSSTSTTDDSFDKIKKLVLENRYFSVIQFSIDKMVIHGILPNVLGTRRIAERLVLKELNFLQKKPDFLKCIITGDEIHAIHAGR